MAVYSRSKRGRHGRDEADAQRELEYFIKRREEIEDMNREKAKEFGDVIEKITDSNDNSRNYARTNPDVSTYMLEKYGAERLAEVVGFSPSGLVGAITGEINKDGKVLQRTEVMCIGAKYLLEGDETMNRKTYLLNGTREDIAGLRTIMERLGISVTEINQ